ncbi:MAG TPA: glycoside hydrolase domain-containing protein [Phycisphaerae bacterium]|nr:glycoside hydrolase domain-containing protein [Phycisphaerae bacterium]
MNRTGRRLASSVPIALVLVSVMLPATAGAAQPVNAPSHTGPTVVLDTTGLWRMHHHLRPPLLALDGGPKPMDLRWCRGDRVLRAFEWASSETPAAPSGWAEEGFDDTAWLRGPARMSCLSPFVARLCMRGRFEVTDPSKVKGLQLSVGYRGGVIVHLNGKEVARRDVAGKDADGAPLAGGYPAEAFTPTGGWSGRWPRGMPLESDKEIALRRRSADIAIPSRLLRKGVNVLGLEIVRAPYHKVVEQMKGKRGSRYCPYCLAFNTCQIDLVRLKAATGEGLVPNATRPKGFQVWNSSALGADYDLDFGDPGPVLPIKLVGARNGRYSGKVVVGCDRTIRNLRAVPSDLSAGGRTIPASAVRIRYGIPWGHEAGVNGQRTIFRPSVPLFNCYPRVPTLLGALAERPLEEFPVRTVESRGADLKIAGQVDAVFGAVVPIWVTVNVPEDAPAGLFKGRITIAAEGRQPHAVPVELEVVDYTLPDPQDYRTVLELIQSPDTLILEYGVKPWSDQHFKLIARSMKLMHEAGVQILYVPLIAQTNHGNEESMVRWIRTGEKSYDYDFSVMDRYLDLAAEHMGRPKVVCFIAWDIYLGGTGGGYKDTWSHNQRSVELRKKYIGKGALVTMLNRGTGQIAAEHLPPYSDPAARAAWTRLFGELRRRMAKRGWEKAMMVGLLSDDWPTDAERRFYRDVTGGLPWVSHSHIPVTRDGAGTDNGIVVTAATRQGNAKVDRVGFRVGYHSAVLSDTFPMNDPPLGSLGGWSREDMGCYQPRYEYIQPASRWRVLMEMNITGRQRGVSRGGADLWSVVRDSRGRRIGNVTKRYPQSAWRNLDIPWCVFAPGPAGPVATHRFEAMREGIQECQARILVEKALTNGTLKAKLGPDLAKRCEATLVERTAFMLKAFGHLQVNNEWGHVTGPEPICRQIGVNGHRWFVGSDWQGRSRRLYSLAGEVQKRLGE